MHNRIPTDKSRNRIFLLLQLLVFATNFWIHDRYNDPEHSIIIMALLGFSFILGLLIDLRYGV